MADCCVGGAIMISIKNLTISYDRQPAVHHLSVEFLSGSLTAITGPNGAGKSSLLKAIAGITQPFEGSIDFNGITRKDLAYLPQSADLQRDFPLNLLQMVTSGYWLQNGVFGGAFGNISKLQKEQALKAIEQVGLKDFSGRTLDTLSSGQFQRALFARLLVQNAKVILLDEPFTAVDEKTTTKLLEIIHHWHEEKRTVLCVLHDIEQIKTHFPDCLLMARQRIAFGKSIEVLKPETMLPTNFFKEALPDIHEVCEV